MGYQVWVGGRNNWRERTDQLLRISVRSNEDRIVHETFFRQRQVNQHGVISISCIPPYVADDSNYLKCLIIGQKLALVVGLAFRSHAKSEPDRVPAWPKPLSRGFAEDD